MVACSQARSRARSHVPSVVDVVVVGGVARRAAGSCLFDATRSGVARCSRVELHCGAVGAATAGVVARVVGGNKLQRSGRLKRARRRMDTEETTTGEKPKKGGI